jgi:hypothetical protein
MPYSNPEPAVAAFETFQVLAECLRDVLDLIFMTGALMIYDL